MTSGFATTRVRKRNIWEQEYLKISHQKTLTDENLKAVFLVEYNNF